MKPFLWIALDALTKKEEQTLELARLLSKQKGNFGFKVNLKSDDPPAALVRVLSEMAEAV
ncbi:MAG TPA: hypothetical protein VJC04_00805 [Candidatus Paceibacterota bacterium]